MKFISNTNLSKSEILDIARSNLDEWKKNAVKCDGDDEFIASLDDEGLIRNFTRVIGFGTAGLRGKMLPGSANMNCETVALATR